MNSLRRSRLLQPCVEGIGARCWTGGFAETAAAAAVVASEVAVVAGVAAAETVALAAGDTAWSHATAVAAR